MTYLSRKFTLNLQVKISGEQQFILARIEDGEVSNFYDEIDSFMELYIPEFGWYYIEEPLRIQKETSQEIKSFKAMSYE